jgi:hypothetical protein
MIRNRKAYPPSQYDIIKSIVHRDDNHERGAAMIIHKKIHYERITLNSELQAVAARINLGKTYTICSIYLPHVNVTL